MKPFIVGLAGGSGSGKSTLSYALEDKYPRQIVVINFDDYQFEDKEKISMYKGFRNWDDPECIEFDKLLKDLSDLKQGNFIVIRSWVSRKNPDYKATGKRIAITIEPKPIIILEGYLALWQPKVRNLLDLMVYLEAPESTRLNRRDKGEYTGDAQGYDEQVLKPMYLKYVAPTQCFC